MVQAKTPTIAEIKNNISLNEARALLSVAVCEVCDFFNVGKNMNDAQIAVTVDLILESFWYMKLEEIKYCFRRAMMREKLFDRIDGNIIIGWLRDYDTERTEEVMLISDQRESQELNELKEHPDAVSYQAYLVNLKERAKTDSEAAEILNEIETPSPQRLTLSVGENERKEHDFKLYRLKYLLNRKKK